MKPLQLDEQQSALLDLHSFLNVLNVFAGELYLIAMQARDNQVMQPVTGKLEQVIGKLSECSFDAQLARELKQTEALFAEDIQHLFGQQP